MGAQDLFALLVGVNLLFCIMSALWTPPGADSWLAFSLNAFAGFWSFWVGYVQYFCRWQWMSWLDLIVIPTACLVVLSLGSYVPFGRRWIGRAAMVVASVLVSYVFGLVARGFADDPTM